MNDKLIEELNSLMKRFGDRADNLSYSHDRIRDAIASGIEEVLEALKEVVEAHTVSKVICTGSCEINNGWFYYGVEYNIDNVNFRYYTTIYDLNGHGYRIERDVFNEFFEEIG